MRVLLVVNAGSIGRMTGFTFFWNIAVADRPASDTCLHRLSSATR